MRNDDKNILSMKRIFCHKKFDLSAPLSLFGDLYEQFLRRDKNLCRDFPTKINSDDLIFV